MYIEVFIFYVSYSQNNPTLHHCFLFILTGLASNEKTAYHFYSKCCKQERIIEFSPGAHPSPLPTPQNLKKRQLYIVSKDNHLKQAIKPQMCESLLSCW